MTIVTALNENRLLARLFNENVTVVYVNKMYRCIFRLSRDRDLVARLYRHPQITVHKADNFAQRLGALNEAKFIN